MKKFVPLLLILLSPVASWAAVAITGTGSKTLQPSAAMYQHTGSGSDTYTVPALSSVLKGTSWEITNNGSNALSIARTGSSDNFYVGTSTATSSSIAAGFSATIYSTGTYWVIDLHGASSVAPTSATYITQTHDSTLSAEQALGDLSTGILKNTTSTGVLSIAAAGTDYLSPSGSGAALTALNASNVASGTLAAARGGAGATTGILKADGSGNVSAASAGTDYLSPSGSGASLTALNATQLTSGTIPSARYASPLVTPGGLTTAGDASIAGNISTTGGANRLFVVNRQDVGSYARFQWQTNGSEKWALGMRGDESSSDRLQLTDAAFANVFYISQSGTFNVAYPFSVGGGQTITKTLSNTATLDFASTAAQNSSDLTITLTGAALNDAVNLGVPNGSVLSNSSYSAWVSATDTVTVRFNNYSSGAQNPASGTFRVTIIKF